MQAKSRSPRLFPSAAGCVAVTILAISASLAQTQDTDLSKDLGRSGFSTTSIPSDLANGHKQVSTAEVIPFSGAGTLVSSQPGAFQYDSQTQQSTAARKVTEAIRATQELEDRRKAEVAEHPFWNAPFWTHSPIAIASFLMGGDHHALETPPTQFEKLGAANYGNEAEVRKFERGVSFGNAGR
jgi:hypothetical protein